MQYESPSSRAEFILSLPISERTTAIRELRSLGRSAAADALEKLLACSLDDNSTTTAIRILGAVGDSENVDTLLRFYDKYRTAVTKALLALGVFDGVLPTENRERRMIRHALNHAKPELTDLIREGRLTRESLLSVLPPIV